LHEVCRRSNEDMLLRLLVDDTLILETCLTSKHTLIVCRPHPPRTKVNILSELFSVPSVLYLMRTVSIYW
jgi:hypothetical protein